MISNNGPASSHSLQYQKYNSKNPYTNATYKSSKKHFYKSKTKSI